MDCKASLDNRNNAQAHFSVLSFRGLCHHCPWHGMYIHVQLTFIHQIILRISYQICSKVRESKLIKLNTRTFHLDCENEYKVERINNKAGLSRQLKNVSYILTWYFIIFTIISPSNFVGKILMIKNVKSFFIGVSLLTRCTVTN